jgi:hypothetical protein
MTTNLFATTCSYCEDPATQIGSGSDGDLYCDGHRSLATSRTEPLSGQPTTAPDFRQWTRERDKYGRTVRRVEEFFNGKRETVGVVVTMPQTARELHPGMKYMVNDYRLSDPGNALASVSRYATIREALGSLGVGRNEGARYAL